MFPQKERGKTAVASVAKLGGGEMISQPQDLLDAALWVLGEQ